VGTNALWQKFATALNAPQLLSDPRFVSNGSRSEHYDDLKVAIGAIFKNYTVRQLEDILLPAGIPIGEIHDMGSVFADPQVNAMHQVLTIPHPKAGDLRVVGAPYVFSETPASVRHHPPLLGEQTDEILSQFGFSAAEIDAFRASGVLG
jgi:crotonobetainyl-CoA:carnitine CoA-transferase CaiB-like acyl-CoA transferase